MGDARSARLMRARDVSMAARYSASRGRACPIVRKSPLSETGSVRRDRAGLTPHRRRGRDVRASVFPFREELCREALRLANALDLDRDGLDRLLDPLKS